MNILFFIGNGFDINIGMKTRYCDFYAYYKDIETQSEKVLELKEDIAKGVTDWSDLEVALGKHTKKIENLEEFDEVYEDIVINLANYLSEEEEKINLKNIKVDKLLRDLCLPEKYLTNEDIEELKSFRSKWSNTTWNLNIITLNYTRTVEKILGDKVKNTVIGHNTNSKEIYFRNIYHIHGYTDERLVLGVNDISQIDNIDFRQNEEILESLVKSTCNKVQRHNIDRLCENRIEEANIICIFGSSIGNTDNYLWNLIGEQLRKNCKLIIFMRGAEIRKVLAQREARKKRDIKSIFLSKTTLSAEEIQEAKNNIYIGINTSLFNIT